MARISEWAAAAGRRAAEEVLHRGPVPLVSIRGRDAARIVRFQSVARPAARLAGRWE